MALEVCSACGASEAGVPDALSPKNETILEYLSMYASRVPKKPAKISHEDCNPKSYDISQLTFPKDSASAFVALGCIFFRCRYIVSISIGWSCNNDVGIRAEDTRRNQFGSESLPRAGSGQYQK